MIVPVTAATRTFALLGDPVSHSASPTIQNAAFAASGQQAVYVSLRCDEESFAPLLQGLARAGGGGNVTIPHKERAAKVIEDLSNDVRRTGACNTFWLEDGKIRGDNTDVEGFRRALDLGIPGSRVGWRVLLLGAGGAARAILVSLLDQGVEHVGLFNRTVERARSVARRIGGERVRVIENPEGLGGPWDLVVNSTPVGLDSEDGSSLSLSLIGDFGGAFDVLYGRDTPLLTLARDRGVPAIDGKGMLIHQGAVAFECWFGQPAPVDAMEGALLVGEGQD